MLKHNIPHQSQCLNCGSIVITKSPRKIYCEDCKALRIRKLRASRTERIDSYTIVYDPNAEYGFKKGAIIYKEEVKNMCYPMNHAFTPGTILRNNEGVFKVRQCQDGKQELVRIEVTPICGGTE